MAEEGFSCCGRGSGLAPDDLDERGHDPLIPSAVHLDLEGEHASLHRARDLVVDLDLHFSRGKPCYEISARAAHRGPPAVAVRVPLHGHAGQGAVFELDEGELAGGLVVRARVHASPVRPLCEGARNPWIRKVL